MRVAVSVTGSEVSIDFTRCEGFKFYEDDHGKVVRQFYVPAEGTGADAALSLLERYGIDALICGTLEAAERSKIVMSGILLYPDASGSADAAVLRFLTGAIAIDESNTCNACGNGHTCSMDCKSCQIPLKN